MRKLNRTIFKVLFLWHVVLGVLIFSPSVMADEVRYFGRLHSDQSVYRFDYSDKFSFGLSPDEIQSNRWPYIKVYFEEGNANRAERIQNGKVLQKYVFDSVGRIVMVIEGETGSDACKIKYAEKIIEKSCFDQKGKLTYREINVYEENLMNFRFTLNKSGELTNYSKFDHSEWKESIFDRDGVLLKIRDMQLPGR